MTDATKYNPLVAWRTLVSNVFQLTREDVDNPATYRLTVKAIDTNDVGYGQKDIGYYLTDYIGTPYRIIAVATNTIDVEDNFRSKHCPTVGRDGIVHKSAYKGRSLYLPAESFRHLHPLAASNNNKYAVSILWANDPNPSKIDFASTDTPALTLYQDLYAEDYGEMPKIQLWEVDGSGNMIERTEKPYYTMVDGLITMISFGTLPEVISGYIIISR